MKGWKLPLGDATLDKVVDNDYLSVAITAIAIKIELDRILTGKRTIVSNDDRFSPIEAASTIHQVKAGTNILVSGTDDPAQTPNVFQHIRNQRVFYQKANLIICYTERWQC